MNYKIISFDSSWIAVTFSPPFFERKKTVHFRGMNGKNGRKTASVIICFTVSRSRTPKNRNFKYWQVSWLVFHSNEALPIPPPKKAAGTVVRSFVHTDSCGGSSGFPPDSLFRHFKATNTRILYLVFFCLRISICCYPTIFDKRYQSSVALNMCQVCP